MVEAKAPSRKIACGQKIFFSCIAELARDMVGQLLEICQRCETLIECRIFSGSTQKKVNKQTNTNKHKTTQHPPKRPMKIRKKGETNRAPLSPS